MNSQVKTILLTIIALSLFTIALVELTGVSSTALFHKYNIGGSSAPERNGGLSLTEAEQRTKQAAAMPKTIIAFTETKYEFGRIKEGDVVKHAFHFKNAGAHPLLIARVEASCGCTIPSFPNNPIPPNGEGDITVQFNSNNRKGYQQKNVMVWSNAQQERMSIGFVAQVE